MINVEQARPALEVASDYATMRVPVASAEETADEVRRAMVGRDFESAVDVAVCDGGRLLGLVTIEKLLAAPGDVSVGALMDTTPPVVAPGVDQEQAAWRAVMQNESSLALVDERGTFRGLVPPQRLLGVLLNEHDEDMARLGGFLHDSESARGASTEAVPRRLWHRLPWLLIGLAGAMVAAGIVAAFADNVEAQVELAFFLPGVVYIADAVGTQTETLVIRGLSVGVPIGAVVRRELWTGVLVGLVLAGAFFPFSWVVWGEVDVSIAVAIALFAACSIATLVAMGLPWAFHRMDRDPAFGSGPLATVVQDLLTLLIYFTVAVAVVK